jgi:hypothetical protein
MRKIEGLTFLSTFFHRIALPTIVLNADTTERDLAEVLKPFRYDVLNVRAGRTFGSEATLPTINSQTAHEVIEFIRSHEADKTLRFVVHPVKKWYFSPLLVGTIALHYSPSAIIIIEFQDATVERSQRVLGPVPGQGAHAGEPRDWPVGIRYTFPFMARMPTVYLSDESKYSLQNISSHVLKFYEVATEMVEIKNSLQLPEEESLTRFNIYRSGRMILSDHRSPDSFAMHRSSRTSI